MYEKSLITENPQWKWKLHSTDSVEEKSLYRQTEVIDPSDQKNDNHNIRFLGILCMPYIICSQLYGNYSIYKKTDEVLHPHNLVTHKDNSSQITSAKLHIMF